MANIPHIFLCNNAELPAKWATYSKPQIMEYRESGIECSLIPPKKKMLYNLFRNANWGYFLDPHKFDKSSFRGYTRIPATQYKTPSEQQNSVNKIVNVILGAIPDMQRADFGAFEWSVNEITDNVLVHSNSKIGGLVQVSTFQKYRKLVQFVVADAGVGIPSTLKEGHPEITSDTDALDKAIREGFTRDKRIGQGNGLFGSYQICSKCHGSFSVHSGHARLEYSDRDGLAISDEKVPYDGTLVVATINFSEPNLLAEALKFKGTKHTPVDFVESGYELSDQNIINFNMQEESESFGSRVSAKPIRTKLFNLHKMSNANLIIIDFKNVPIISSSFADEAFAKLFLEVGPMEFMKKFKFVNVMATVQQIVDKAIQQRVTTGVID